ncbi:MAG: leucyl/phenylalanyl-tRNA--protein transferase [Chloroflexi bacterium]|nr:leucyl/phenylalanyl-tRNA--protein transferase [Chloroflexota bacterium]
MSTLTTDLLISAYRQGVFPMAIDGQIYWYDPNPRAILPLDGFHMPRSLMRAAKRAVVETAVGSQRELIPAEVRRSAKPGFLLTLDRDFRGVITACADPRRNGSWIDEQILEAYVRLYHQGLAHSVETWQDGRLVGGLYGVSLNGLFAGEAMFSRATDASKVALVYLVQHLRQRGYALLDVQFQTEHLTQFGVIEIPRAQYRARLRQALQVQTTFAE